MMQVDASEVVQLAADLATSAVKIGSDSADVVSDEADKLQKDYEQQIASSTHFHGMAGSITTTVTTTGAGTKAEVGPDKSRRGGPLGNIFFFGTPRGGGTGDLDGPLREEEPRFVKALSDLAAEDML